MVVLLPSVTDISLIRKAHKELGNVFTPRFVKMPIQNKQNIKSEERMQKLIRSSEEYEKSKDSFDIWVYTYTYTLY